MGEPRHRRSHGPTAAPPPDLVAAPGYGARRMYQAYLAAWNRHVDGVTTGPQFANAAGQWSQRPGVSV